MANRYGAPTGLKPGASDAHSDTRIGRRESRRRNITSGVFAVLFVLLCLVSAWFFLPNFPEVIKGDTSELQSFALIATPTPIPEPTPEPTPTPVTKPGTDTRTGADDRIYNH